MKNTSPRSCREPCSRILSRSSFAMVFNSSCKVRRTSRNSAVPSPRHFLLQSPPATSISPNVKMAAWMSSLTGFTCSGRSLRLRAVHRRRSWPYGKLLSVEKASKPGLLSHAGRCPVEQVEGKLSTLLLQREICLFSCFLLHNILTDISLCRR